MKIMRFREVGEADLLADSRWESENALSIRGPGHHLPDKMSRLVVLKIQFSPFRYCVRRHFSHRKWDLFLRILDHVGYLWAVLLCSWSWSSQFCFLILAFFHKVSTYSSLLWVWSRRGELMKKAYPIFIFSSTKMQFRLNSSKMAEQRTDMTWHWMEWTLSCPTWRLDGMKPGATHLALKRMNAFYHLWIVVLVHQSDKVPQQSLLKGGKTKRRKAYSFGKVWSLVVWLNAVGSC